MKHIIGLSGGKDSVAMALHLKELNPEQEYHYISTPTGNEPPDLFEHFKTLEKILDAPIRFLKPYAGDGLIENIRDNKCIPNFRMRFCTRQLKIEPTISYLKANSPCYHYVGLRADEEERQGIYGDIEGITHNFPMREWGWDIQQVWHYLDEQGVSIPERTDCALCFFQRMIQWKRLWQNHPKLYQKGVDIENEMGRTFRTPKKDSWPTSLEDLRKEFENGRMTAGEAKLLNDEQQMRLFQDCDLNSLCRVCTM